MDKIKKFLQKIKNQPAVVTALMLILSILVIAVALYIVISGYDGVLAYIFYGLSAIALSYAVYIVIIIAPKVKGGIIKYLKKYKFTAELLENFGYRKLIFAIVSFIFNILYAIMHAVFAILSRSIWLGALATYYIALSAIRGGAVVVCGKTREQSELLIKQRQIRSYKNCGLYLVLLNFALMGALVQMVISNQGFMYAGYLIYVMAAYTFCKITFSIIHLFKLKSTDDYSVRAINNIGLANSLVSMFALQTAMFAAFGGGIDTRIPNAATGGAISIGIILIGVYMFVKGYKEQKKIKMEILNERR
ncbi:MAG: hypothetical protein IKA11_04420 [Clostridia bacterium]|nr:hypothetical protein [Clostridia bacterium]